MSELAEWEIEILDEAASWSRLDRVSRHYLGIPAGEFLRRYEADDLDCMDERNVERVAFLLSDPR